MQMRFLEETHKYGHVAMKNISNLNKLLAYWNPEAQYEYAQIRDETAASTAIASLFSWLNGQAHCLGKHKQQMRVNYSLNIKSKEFLILLLD